MIKKKPTKIKINSKSKFKIFYEKNNISYNGSIGKYTMVNGTKK